VRPRRESEAHADAIQRRRAVRSPLDDGAIAVQRHDPYVSRATGSPAGAVIGSSRVVETAIVLKLSPVPGATYNSGRTMVSVTTCRSATSSTVTVTSGPSAVSSVSTSSPEKLCPSGPSVGEPRRPVDARRLVRDLRVVAAQLVEIGLTSAFWAMVQLPRSSARS
jgi:hypothetical protein